MASSKTTLILDIPVIHSGYIKLLDKYRNQIDNLYIVGRIIKKKLGSLEEIRSISPFLAKKIVSNLGYSFKINILSEDNIKSLRDDKLILSKDAISSRIVRKFFSKKSDLIYDTAFLRWDEHKVISTMPVGRYKVLSKTGKNKLLKIIDKEANKSSDWWRRVGAVLIKDRSIIASSHNHHMPSENTPYIDGDPRDYIKAGQLGYLSSSVHAELDVIAEAVKKGVALKGASIYVNVFPCPTCARLIVKSGITKCFFLSGNAYLNSEEVLVTGGVRLYLLS